MPLTKLTSERGCEEVDISVRWTQDGGEILVEGVWLEPEGLDITDEFTSEDLNRLGESARMKSAGHYAELEHRPTMEPYDYFGDR